MASKNENNDDEPPNNTKPQKEENLFSFLADPFESKIPEEYKNEIYQAEGNTKAAKERGPRIALYAVVALIGIGVAFFNAFLTELRNPADETMTAMSLDDLGFDWVHSNFLWQFLFLNKIGGGLALIAGAGSGLLAELEFDSRRKNAEAIWEELQTRKLQKQKQQQKLYQQQQQGIAAKRKKREGSKEAKRMAALSEVVDLEDSATSVVSVDGRRPAAQQDMESKSQPVEATTTTTNKQAEDEKKGIFQSLQGFYEKADAMAASQALLINKQLEDAGVLEKITDETGLKVIGREAASKLQEKPTPTEPGSTNNEDVKSKESQS